jgi:glucose-1-phosphate thymidylyltransferase
MYLGDNVLQEGLTQVAEEFDRTRPDAQIVVYKVPNPSVFGVAEVNADGTVERLVEKPQRPRTDLAVIGVYFFTAAIHEAVRAIEPSARGELEITDAIQWLLDKGAVVRAREYDGFWKDTGQVDDVLECNRRLLGGVRPAVLGEVDEASELSGRVVVEAGARVVRSRIEGPAIIGANTLIEDSRIGPNAAIGGDCVVRATDVADSIVLDGASIIATPSLRESIIGRSATIGAGPDGAPRHHRLLVGDHARVEIAA